MDRPNRIFEFSENHPHLLVVAVIVLLIIIVVMVFRNRIPGSRKRESACDPATDDDEMDKIIDEIHDRQKSD